MENINSFNKLSSFYQDDINIVRNVELFYINKKHVLNPAYNVMNYYFFIINGIIYINDYESEYAHLYNFFNFENTLLYSKKFDIFNNQCLHIDKCILLRNNYSNVGHSFFNILRSIVYYHNNLENKEEYKIVICDDILNYNKFLISLVYLFFKKEEIIILPDKTLLKTNEFVLIKDYSHKYDKHIPFLMSKLKQKIDYSVPNNFGYDKLCLIKTVNTLNATTDRCFNNSYEIFFKNNGFKMIKPEEYIIEDLYNIVYNSKLVVLSWGCCSYLNSTFVNPNSNTLLLCHINYNHEYNKHIQVSLKLNNTLDYFYSICLFPESPLSNKKCILDLETNLSKETEDKILDILEYK